MLDLWLQGSGQWLGNQRSRCPMGAPWEQGHLCLNWPQRAVWSPSQTDASPRLVKHMVRTVPAPRGVFSLPLQKDTCCMWCELHPNSPSISFGPLDRNFEEASSWLFFFFPHHFKTFWGLGQWGKYLSYIQPLILSPVAGIIHYQSRHSPLLTSDEASEFFSTPPLAMTRIGIWDETSLNPWLMPDWSMPMGLKV